MNLPLALAILTGPVAAPLLQGIGSMQAPHPAVVRVIATQRDGVSYGSGALVAVNRSHGLVVTNWHVVCKAENIAVVFPDGFRSRAQLLRSDRHWDLAALAVRRPRVQPIPMANVAPRPGEILIIAGYGRGWYRASAGRCTQYVAPGWNQPFEMIELSTQARQGDSGGPILNQRGELAGVLFGASWGRTTGSYCGRVGEFLASVDRQFQQLAPPENMVAENRPSSSLPAAAAQPQPAPRLSSSDSSSPGPLRRLPAREQLAEGIGPPATAAEGPRPAPIRLTELPRRPRSQVPPASMSAPLQAEAQSQSSLSGGSGPMEQIKTVLAAIGAFAILFHGLRLLTVSPRS